MEGVEARAKAVLEKAGQTYAQQAGITLENTPAPLYRLLLMSVLLSTRIRADIAVDATRELVRSGFGTARTMAESTWHQRVRALGRAHYVRYDESTATALGKGAELLLDRYGGDLRRLREAAGSDVNRVRELLQEVPRLGPVGADIFCREAQDVWTELSPFFDAKAREGAKRIDLPIDALEGLVPQHQRARLAAALVRVALDKKLAAAVTSNSD